MNKNAIKKFATEARRELISRVGQRALKYGISDKEVGNPNDDSVGGHLLSSTEKQQRAALIKQIKEKGYEQVMEEVAYTWFNRFSALRFMEVNGYLPTRVRVFTDENNAFKPQILTDAIHMELDGLDMEKVYAYKDANDNDELYKYLLITQCNALNSVLPGMFQKIADYTELLFPDNLLREGSVVQQMIELIPEEDWNIKTIGENGEPQGQIEIIGWLYQYYITEEFDAIYDGNMSRGSVASSDIPAATQLFTPEWAVKVMVENSLGRMWIEGHPESIGLKNKWDFYVDDIDQDDATKVSLHEVYREYSNIEPTLIMCIDPCMGSGHILVRFFDTLMNIYESYGYSAREAASLILKNNIYGLELDERAAQLAEFSLLMKARQYDRKIFEKGIKLHLYHFQNLCLNPNDFESQDIKRLIGDFRLASDVGSLLTLNYNEQLLQKLRTEVDRLENNLFTYNSKNYLQRMVDIATVLSKKYDVVVTNPPYLSNKRFNACLSGFIKENYPEGKADLAMAMLQRLIWGLTRKNGYCAAITTVSWMYLKNLSDFRFKVVKESDFVCLIDYGTELFEGKIGHLPIASWVSRNSTVKQNFPSIRLIDFCYSRRDEKIPEFYNRKNHYAANQKNIEKIEGVPIAYWLTDNAVDILEKCKSLDEKAITRAGMITGSNDIFVRMWHEIGFDKLALDCASREEAVLSKLKWFPYSKGGNYRKWYGNNESVVNWYNDGDFMRSRTDENGKIPAHAFNLEYIFKTNICWNSISTNRFSARLTEKGFLYDAGGSFAHVPAGLDKYYLGLLNSCVSYYYLTAFNPTLNFQKGNVGTLPIIVDEKRLAEINKLVTDCVNTSTIDWDSNETSWGHKSNPLIMYRSGAGYADVPMDRWQYRIVDAYHTWESNAAAQFDLLKKNEEELNRIFIDIYGLQDELTPEVEDKDVTIRKADLERDIKSFISYAVGCMFGRYSLDVDGLAYAGGEWDDSKYSTFAADKDNIIPISDDEYFEDDIVGRFVKFVEVVYGKETLQENLRFIADALGGNGQPKDVIRNYFMNGFYADHCKMYQKRPIYWMFDSGKKNGFKCLIYMHRYQPDTLARIRTDYVHEQQARYRTAIADLETRIASASTSERVKLNKQLKTLNDQAKEIHEYEEKIHHLADQMISIDLDDGVKKNYEIFKDVLAKIK